MIQKKEHSINTLQKMGGVAALIEAATFIVGFALFSTVLAPYMAGDLNMAFLVENESLLYLANLIIYVLFGVWLVVLALALYARIQSGAPAIMQTATVFGFIWAGLVIASGMVANIGTGVVVNLYAQDPVQAASVWLAIDAVVNGLGGGNEIVGGLWVLLASWAALRAGELPAALNYLGVLIGAAGVITLVPALGELGVGAVFGLGLIVWFGWLGMVMLRSKPHAAAEKTFRTEPDSRNRQGAI